MRDSSVRRKSPGKGAGKVEDRLLTTLKIAGLAVGTLLMLSLPASAAVPVPGRHRDWPGLWAVGFVFPILRTLPVHQWSFRREGGEAEIDMASAE